MTTTRTAGAAVAARLAADRRRRRTHRAVAVAVVVLVAAAVLGSWLHDRGPVRDVRLPAGVTAGDDTGIARGTGAVRVDLYVDFLCPNCRQLETSAAGMLDDLVARGTATVVVHPVAFLDRMSRGTEYSTRASAASGCAADGHRFAEYVRALFGRQPAENTPGPPDSRLVEIGRSVGLGDDFAACVRDRRYLGWTGHVTDQAARRRVAGTPTVQVGGTEVTPDPAKIRAAIAAAGGR